MHKWQRWTVYGLATVGALAIIAQLFPKLNKVNVAGYLPSIG